MTCAPIGRAEAAAPTPKICRTSRRLTCGLHPQEDERHEFAVFSELVEAILLFPLLPVGVVCFFQPLGKQVSVSRELTCVFRRTDQVSSFSGIVDHIEQLFAVFPSAPEVVLAVRSPKGTAMV